MKARPATEEESRHWDRLLQETARPHLLQSSGWAKLKSATGWRAERYILEDDSGRRGLAQVLRKRVARAFELAYAPRGPLCDEGVLADAVVAAEPLLPHAASFPAVGSFVAVGSLPGSSRAVKVHSG